MSIKVNITDEQKKVKLPTGTRLLIRKACIATLKLEGFPDSAEINVTLVNDDMIKEMNKKFNFNKAVFPGIQGGPLMHVIAGKAVCFKEALQPEYKTYMEQVVRNAKALCNGLKSRGVKIVSGDTDNHLMLVDLSGTDISGKELEKRLDDAHVTANKNTIPNDPRSPFVTSGVRLGTPAVTTRGMKEEDMDKIAEIIAMVIESEDNVEKAKAMVAELTAKYPLC